jgi:Ssp1 endopeptidase immunity protein Rap1a
MIGAQRSYKAGPHVLNSDILPTLHVQMHVLRSAQSLEAAESARWSGLASVASAGGGWSAMARWACCAVLATGLLVSTAHAASNFSGNDWRPLTAEARGLYVLGVIDGVLEMGRHERSANPTLSSLLARIVEKLERCAGDRMTRGQAIALVEKYVTDHPEQWQLSMADLVLIAMGEACPS